jgi:hypothetical protein
MQLIDDGDIVRAIGYVVIYAAYLEKSIDECLELFIELNKFNKKEAIKQMKKPTSQKIKFIEKQIELLKYDSFDIKNRTILLPNISDLLEQRNIAIHSGIYAIPSFGDIQISSRDNEKNEIHSNQLYLLANELFNGFKFVKSLASFLNNYRKILKNYE